MVDRSMTKRGACCVVPRHYAPGCVRTATRSRTLTVAVTYPGTNAHKNSLISSKVHTTIYKHGTCDKFAFLFSWTLFLQKECVNVSEPAEIWQFKRIWSIIQNKGKSNFSTDCSGVYTSETQEKNNSNSGWYVQCFWKLRFWIWTIFMTVLASDKTIVYATIVY